MAATPTLIGMPEPPSNPDTPTEAPGTPNSTTTSLSTLSTTAIKDGHRGALPSYHGHHHTRSSNTLEAERADRISRLAGLERVSTARPSNPALQPPGYFDHNGNPVYTTKMSTVGSASATGSVGGGRTTTWASGSAKGEGEGEGDEDHMSIDANPGEETETDRYSDMERDGDGMSDDTSLVGFGEGAGSTVSGPIYTRRDLASVGRSASGLGTPGTPADGGRDAAERIVRERLDEGEGRRPPLGSPDEAGLGRFYFEEKK